MSLRTRTPTRRRYGRTDPNIVLSYFPGGPPPKGFVHTRATPATQVNKSLEIETVGVDVLRDGHYVAGGQGPLIGPGTLLEQGRVNLLLWSQDFEQGAWVRPVGVVVVPNDAIGLDGQLTATRIEDTNPTSFATIHQEVAIAADTTIYTPSVWVRKVSGQPIALLRLLFSGAGTVTCDVRFNVETGEIRQSDSVPLAYGIEDEGEFWRVWLSHANDGVNTAVRASFFPAVLPSGSSLLGGYDPNTVGYHHVPAMQLEKGVSPSSYIKTEGATVTRSADVLYMDFTPVPQAMQVYVKFVEGGGAAIDGRIWTIGDGTTANPRIAVFWSNNRIAFFYHNNAANQQLTSASLTVPVGTVEVLFTIDGDGVMTGDVSLDGVAQASFGPSAALALPALWSAQRLYLNRGASVDGLNTFLAGPIVRLGTGKDMDYFARRRSA